MAKHRIEIMLTDEEERFLKWLAEYDNEDRTPDQSKMTINKELDCLLSLQIRETMDYYSQGGIKSWEN